MIKILIICMIAIMPIGALFADDFDTPPPVQ